MKRFVCFLLTLVMIVSLVPATVLTASAASSLTTSDKAIEILKLFEGFRSKPYQDGSEWYIGYGTLVKDPTVYNDGITKTEATILLKDFIHPDDDNANLTVDERINEFAKKWNIAFTQYQHDALALFTYNCGWAWMYSDGAFRNAVISGKRGNEFLNAIALWNGGNADSDYFRGLMNRRLAEANMYLNNSYSSAAPTNYTYVVLDTNGGSLTDSYGNNLIAYAYDSSTAPALNLTPTSSDTFVGWYDKDGKPVTTLDSTTSKATLTAKWQTGGNVTAKYDINSSECASRKVYGGDLTTLKGELKANSKATVTAEFVDADNVKWVYVTGKDTKNKTISGWVALYDMDEKEDAQDTVLATGTVTAELNVREASTTESAILGQLPKGTIVKILAYKNEYTVSGTRSWGKIMFNGSVGWINLAYVDLRSAGADDNTSIYGKTGKIVNAAEVNIRSAAGVGNALVTKLKEGTEVTVYETEVVGTGANAATWGRIKWDGVREGWVYMYYVQLDGQSTSGTGSVGSSVAIYTGVVNSNTNLNVRAAATVSSALKGSLPKGTKINIYEKTTTNKVEWGRTDNGWVCLLYVTLTATGNTPSNDPTHVLKKDVGTVTAATLTIRKTATNNSEIIGSLKQGDSVTIEEQVTETTATGSKIWGKVTVGEITGYINLAYVSIEEVTDYIPDNGTVGGTTNNGTGSAGFISGCTNVNVRSAAGVGSTLVKTLPAGTNVTVYDQVEHNNAPWGRTEHGWVCMYYVTLTGETSNGTDGTTGGTTGGNDNNGYANGTEPGVISATGVVNSNTDLNVRSGPGLGYAKVSSLKRGTQVTVYEQKVVDRMTWGKVSNGWVCMSYITVNATANSGKGVMGTVARCFSHVNVRSAPGTGNALVGTIQVGARVEVFEQKLYNNQYWGRVAQGWVCMEYILLDEELPPSDSNTTTDPTTPSEGTGDTGATNPNASLSFSFFGTVSQDLNVRKDATSKSGLAGTVAAGMKVQVVALKFNRNEDTNLPEMWGKIDDYGTPGWINLAYVTIALNRYVQFDNVTVYSIASTSGEDLALIHKNAPVTIIEVALEGSTVWGKIDLDTVPDAYLAQDIGGLVGWIQMSKVGTEPLFVIPTHNESMAIGGFVGRTYGEISAYTNVLAQEVSFKLIAGAAVSIDQVNLNNGTVWGRVKGTDGYGNDVYAWINVAKVMFQITCNVVSADGLNVRTVPFGNDDSTVKAIVADGETLYITSLMLSDNGELWGQVQGGADINGGWVNMSFTSVSGVVTVTN